MDIFERKESIGFTLAPDEFLMMCPYNTAHFVLNKRYGLHLRKCREVYLAGKRDREEVIEWYPCRHNCVHVVPLIELPLHEMRCPDKGTISPFELKYKLEDYFAAEDPDVYVRWQPAYVHYEVLSEDDNPEAASQDENPTVATQEVLPEAAREDVYPEAAREDVYPEAAREDVYPEATVQDNTTNDNPNTTC